MYSKLEAGQAHMTPQSTIVIGVRRSIGNMAATTMGATLLDTMDGSTVRRAEEKTGASLVSNMMAFHTVHEVR